MSIDEAIEKESKIAKENQKIVDTQIVFDNVSISELYCDDTEAIEEHLSNYKKCAEYHEQIAEWLEDYKQIKMLVPLEQALKKEYCKGIDDFISKLDYESGYDEDFNDDECIYEISRMTLLSIAEQLKAGGTDGN